MAVTLSHPSIGDIQASTRWDGVIQCLGVQYATLSDRFATPVLKQYPKGSTLDATKLGPSVHTVPNGATFEQGLLQHTLSNEGYDVEMSDTEGLNLNITIPKTADGTPIADQKLPVYAFIHGGGFQGGSSHFPQYDLARFVHLSAAKGMPLIAVSNNYRLGPHGFLYSEELKEAGYKANNGLRDQRAALLWIQQYISGFGGDPSNVTLMGESAGGVAVCYHLHSEKPLFKRAMAMSGLSLLMPILPLPATEHFYNVAIKALGLESKSKEDRVHQLLSMDGQELRNVCMKAGVATFPALDGDLLSVLPTFENIMSGEIDMPGRQWCEGILLGDCQFDGNIQALRLAHRKKGFAKAFVSSIQHSFSDMPGFADKMLSSYSFSADLSDDEAFVKVLVIASDISWYATSLGFAQGMEKSMPVYMYRFNEGNPWPGQWQGKATHILDLVFVTQNFNEFLSDAQKQMAERFAEDVIKFVNGKEPWTPWKSERKMANVLLAEKPKGNVVEDVPEKTGRSQIVLDLAEEVGFDRLNDAFNEFMKGPPPT